MSEIATLADAEAYLEGLINLERRTDWPYSRIGLEPIRALLGRLENPERKLRVVHLAGSKGKGSTALMVEALLRAAGTRVGTFTSPHLESWAERFRLEGRDIDADLLVAAVRRVRPHIEALGAASPGNAPTFFDAITAVALLCFAEHSVDWAVLEVGLGGRLDSTNAVSPALTCITSIELEHTEILGDRVELIAAEKAGIVKAGVPLVLGRVPPPAREVIVARAKALDAAVLERGRDFEVEAEPGAETTLLWGRAAIPFRLPVLGAHQGDNAALALVAVGELLKLEPEALAACAERAFADLVLPGRVEVVGRDPWLVIDAAHTEASARALADALRRVPGAAEGIRFVVSISGGKELERILDAWVPIAGRFTVTRALAPRSLDPERIARAIRARAPGLPVSVEPDPERALLAARGVDDPAAPLCATGSIYLAGIARRVWSVDD